MPHLANIRIKTTTPLHSYLADNPGLCVRLLADGDVRGTTPFVKADLKSGIWEINSNLPLPETDQTLTLAVLADKGSSKGFELATFNVAELLASVETSADEYREFFATGHAIEFTVTCSVKLSSSPVPEVSPRAGPHDVYGDDVYTVPRKGRSQDKGSTLQGEGLELLGAGEQLKHAAVNLLEQDERAHELSLLGGAYTVLCERSGKKADLEKAISTHEEAMRLEHSDYLGISLQYLFGQSGDIADLERAIRLHQNALAMTDDGDQGKPSRLDILGNALQARFEHIGQLSDLQKAISLHQRAVELTPEGHPDKVVRLANFGRALQSRFTRLGLLSDINTAISLCQKAVELTPDSDPNKPNQLGNLGTAFWTRFERLGDLADINKAILTLQTTVELMPDHHPYKTLYLTNLGGAFHKRFERLGSIADIDSANLSLRRAVELTPNGHPDKPRQLSTLGCMLQKRFERLGDLTDIDNAILLLQNALELTPYNDPNKPDRLSTLGDALQTRFKRFGVLADIENAIQSLRTAMQLMPNDHQAKPTILNNLGRAFHSRFQRLDVLSDMNTAISLKRKAVELTPDSHPNKPTQLNSLGTALCVRFGRLGSLVDINEAISSLQLAIKLTPSTHPSKSLQLTNLGFALRKRFERLGSLADVDNAISLLERAVEITPDDHPSKPLQLSNLGCALQDRFMQVGSLADINNAISLLQKAVELIPESDVEKPRQLSTLGCALQKRFERLDDLADIDSAISSHQKAVELMPEDHPDKPALHRHLGASLGCRFECLRTPENLEGALQNYSIAANSRTGPAIVRFTAARAWARIADKYSQPSLLAYRCAIDLLPRIAWLGLEVSDQHALLAGAGDIVRDAVAAAIQLEKYETAVEWAEQGRSIVWQNILGLRTPLDDLRAAHPQLAGRLQTVTRQLESPPSTGVDSDIIGAVIEPDITRKYSELATEWEGIVEEIRKIPEFEEFLKPKRFSTLAPAAYEGPVVILNVHASRCDALLLLSENKRVSTINIPLEGFSYEMSENLLQTLAGLLSSAGVRQQTARKHEWVGAPIGGDPKFKTILRILWHHVVKPVIECLNYEIHSDNPPRIWWCATGFLSFLPIHAAGLYGSGETGESLSDYAVSSYTPTLTAILDMTEPIVQEDFQLLTVAQPAAPNAAPIPKTVDEVTLVQGIASGVRVVSLMSEDATVRRVLDEMKKSNWIHLACHGQQNVENAMKSGFLLHDGTLELSNIVRTILPKADFAFLSACQTATGDVVVAEESVHLAAGMLLSGCRGVIATMWSIRDDDGPQVAGEVYRRMLKDRRPNRKEAAYALHGVVKHLKESGAGFMAWVPFIHIGR